ncbi:MAG: aspartate-semialdehyde dehydrogenase [Synergistaceae bacterium]|nr:aspartate-semialdehyde dehydrogenase [Synergistaceae bacterium]
MKVAVLGATGLVGREMLAVLEQRNFPVDELVPLASARSAGRDLLFRGREWTVREVEDSAFDGVQLALFSAGSEASRRWAPVAAGKGTVVIDNSSAWRMDPEVPLVVPEVNRRALKGHRGIIANPNCATIQALVALYPLHLEAGLESFTAVTFQSVSGTGKAALEELREGTEAFLSGKAFEPKVYPRPIAFNAIPQIGSFDDEGISQEEWKMVNESRKILGIPDLAVSCTTVRVPVFRGHSEAITAIFRTPLSPERARAILKEAPGVALAGEAGPDSYATALDVPGTDAVVVGRIRRDTGSGSGLSHWVVADNLRKGAALNAVQIAEELLSTGHLI